MKRIYLFSILICMLLSSEMAIGQQPVAYVAWKDYRLTDQCGIQRRAALSTESEVLVGYPTTRAQQPPFTVTGFSINCTGVTIATQGNHFSEEMVNYLKRQKICETIHITDIHAIDKNGNKVAVDPITLRIDCGPSNKPNDPVIELVCNGRFYKDNDTIAITDILADTVYLVTRYNGYGEPVNNCKIKKYMVIAGGQTRENDGPGLETVIKEILADRQSSTKIIITNIICETNNDGTEKTCQLRPITFTVQPNTQTDLKEPTDSIYKTVEKAPAFIGGEAALFKYIADNVVYPAEARAQGAQGKVYCEFVVEKDGSISHVRVVRSSKNDLLDAEAVRVVKTMPAWQAGLVGGQAVRTQSFLPVTFKIEAETETVPGVMEIADRMPEFPGGQQALFEYLSSHVQYPYEARRDGIEGQALCSFVVETDGSVTNVYIARSSGSTILNQEALRVVRSMPKWNPAKQNGQLVPVKYSVPINFSMKNAANKSRYETTNAEKVLQEFLNKKFNYPPITSGVNDLIWLKIDIPLKVTIDTTGIIRSVALQGEINGNYRMVNGRSTVEEKDGKVVKISKTTFDDNKSLKADIDDYCHHLESALDRFIITMNSASIRCNPSKIDNVPFEETITIKLQRDGMKKYRIKEK